MRPTHPWPLASLLAPALVAALAAPSLAISASTGQVAAGDGAPQLACGGGGSGSYRKPHRPMARATPPAPETSSN